MNLAVGTAQFGCAYGIANRVGQVERDDARDILGIARDAGVTTLDTAMSYGDAEARLGEIGVDGWRIVSKLPAMPPDSADVGGWVSAAVDGSLDRLRVSRLSGLLLHRPRELLEPRGDALSRALQRCVDDGRVERIGISVYEPAELEQIIGRFQIQIVQGPFSVIDRRLLTSGWLDRLHAADVEVHARSIFLQGLLLMERRPHAFRRWASVWSEWDGWLASSGVSALHACLGFVAMHPQIAYAVVGVESPRQMAEIVVAARSTAVPVPATLSSDDPGLVNPSRWAFS